jgi:TonB-linked SusC/RagA family outer membrane protein
MRVIVTIGLLFISAFTFAQRMVSGKVLDDKGAALVGASVGIKNTELGTMTDENGMYSLEVPSNDAVLVISYIGFTNREVIIGDQTEINFSMEADQKLLDEVVVVGYGTQDRKAITGSVVKIDGDRISSLVTPSIDKQLSGRAAGVQVIAQSGLINQTPRILIRGVNSISQNTGPLIVVDGVPVVSGGTSGITNTNALSDINPNDIESIETLKDGASSAIYGSRAANGVILITTKRGKAGKPKLTYDAYFGRNSAFKKFDLLNANEFVEIKNEGYLNAGQPIQAKNNEENTNTDWQDVIFNKKAGVQSHTISLRGGTENTGYYVSANFSDQKGIIQTNDVRRYALRGTFDHTVNKYLKIGTSLNLAKTDDADQNNGGNALSGAMTAALRALPNVRVYNPSHPTGYNITNDYAALGQDSNRRAIENNFVNIKYVLDNNKYLSERYRILANTYAQITPIEGLTIRTQGSVDYANTLDFLAWNSIHGDGRSSNGIISSDDRKVSVYLWQNYATYDKVIGKNNLGFTLGADYEKNVSKRLNGGGSGFSDPFFLTNGLISNSFAVPSSGGFYGEAGFVSYYGRINYAFASKYFLQLSYRTDGQSSLAKEKRFGGFPGVSVGYTISEEDFFKKSNLGNIVNNFKIRASYGVVGNRLTGFPYLSTYGSAPYGSLNGIAFNLAGNPDLKWETNTKYNVGIDLAFLNSRVRFTADYFINQNDGLVLAVPVPPSLGIPGNSISQNIGKMENRGIELGGSFDAVRKSKFSWFIEGNVTFLKNKVISLVNKQDIISTFNIIREGEPINSFYGFQYAGVNPLNGNPMYIKNNEGQTQIQGNIANSTYYTMGAGDSLGVASSLATSDKRNLGNPNPTWFGSLTNTFNYEGFGLEIMLRFSGGNKIFNQTAYETLYNLGFQNSGSGILNRWKSPGDVTDVPRLWAGRDNFINQAGGSNLTSRWIEKGDFLKIQNIILSYTVPVAKVKSMTKDNVSSLRFYFQLQNYFTFTKYSGIDPENTTSLGIDYSTVPSIKTFSFGLNLGL